MTVDVVIAIVNIAVALIAAYENGLFYWRFRKRNARHWIKLWYVLISLYWAGIFAYTLFNPHIDNIGIWHSVIVKPAITITLAAIASSAIMRMKVYKE